MNFLDEGKRGVPVGLPVEPYVEIELNERGYIETDPETFETSVPGIYAGGDVSNEGPATIVKAAASGKAIANHILGRRNEKIGTAAAQPDVARLLRHRSHRQRRVMAKTTPVTSRDRDTEVMLTYSEADARAEASRCLDRKRDSGPWAAMMNASRR